MKPKITAIEEEKLIAGLESLLTDMNIIRDGGIRPSGGSTGTTPRGLSNDADPFMQKNPISPFNICVEPLNIGAKAILYSKVSTLGYNPG